MNTLTLMKKSLNFTFTLLLGAFVVVGLSACAESQTGDGMDTASTNQDTAMSQQDGMGGGQQGGMMQDSVSLQSTNQLLQGQITQIPMRQARQNIQGWQSQLDMAGQDASGQAGQAISDINNTLGDLSDALQGGSPDGQAVGEAFTQLNEQMNSLMQNASSLSLQQGQQQQLSQLQSAIQAASQSLGGSN